MNAFKIIIVGAGGLGVGTATELSELWPSESFIPLEIHIFDPDLVELSNLNRQFLFDESVIGLKKSQALCSELSLRYPQHSFTAHTELFEPATADAFLDNCSAICEGSDSAKNKFLLNDFCLTRGIPYSYAGVLGTEGQSLLSARHQNRRPVCLRCLYGNPSDLELEDQTHNCQSAGVLGLTTSKTSIIQAQTLLSFLFDSKNSSNQLHRFSFPEVASKSSNVEPEKSCPNGCSISDMRVLDLSKKECPETFILSKLALEAIDIDSFLLLKFGCKKSFQTVSNSLAEEGVSCRSLGRDEDSWFCSVRRT